MKQLQDLVGTDFICDACGRRHKVSVREVIVAEDALARLPDLCSRYASGKRLVLFADSRTHRLAGAAAERGLKQHGFIVATVIVPDPEVGHAPVCDDITREWIEARLGEADVYVAVGSGVISDLTKWIAGDRKIPYLTVGTAASMNGYTSDNIAPTIRGVKSLLYGTGPVAILAVPSILAAAPAEMTAAGLGDVLAKPVSAADWRLNRVVFDEYYCPLCAGLINEIQPLYLSNPEGIRDRNTASIQTLLDALLLTGLSMSMAGTSSPASGGEHLISHCLDMMAMRDGTQHDLHGRQVGIGTIIGAALYEEILAMDRPRFADCAGTTDPAFWGRFTEAVEAEHCRKREKAVRAVQILRENPTKWDEIRAAVRPDLLTPRQLKDCLTRGGAAHRLADIGVTRERFLLALLHAHEIRERYTILDLARAVGVLPVRAEALVDKWVVS